MKKSQLTTQINIILSFLLALFLLLASASNGAAQGAAPFIRQVQSIEAEDTGLESPSGLAFSSRANAFYVLESHSKTSAPGTDIVKLTTLGRPSGTLHLETFIQDPGNVAYDNKVNRLLILQSASSQLMEVSEGSNRVVVHNIKAFGLQNPHGLVVDPSSGSLFILDAVDPRIVHIEPDSAGDLDNTTVSTVNLPVNSQADLRGIAFDPTTGNLQVLDFAGQKLLELTQSGKLVASRDVSEFFLGDPQAMTFAPSGDQTDDPAQLSLYIADSGRKTTSTQSSTSGQIVELSLVQPTAAAAINYVSSLVKVTNMAAMNPPSPDPSGIAYRPASNNLIIVDGEVEETVSGITHFLGANVWELTLSGGMIRTANISKVAPTVVPMTNEPTGIAWNPYNGHYFISDDSALEVWDLNPGADKLVGTADDTWTSFDTQRVGGGDPEGVTFDTWHNSVFVADGVNAEIYQFSSTGTFIGQFDVAQYGVVDPESVEFNTDTGTLLVLSNAQTGIIIETTVDGALLQTISVAADKARAAAGLALAPASNGSGESHFYIVDRGIDNNTDPKIVDGLMYELTSPFTGTPAATSTATNTPDPNVSPTPTNTATNTATSTNTPTPTATFTPTLPPSSNPLFASFASNGTVGGIAFADEDILRFDGSTWNLYFDGSDVGVGSMDVDAFSPLNANTLLFSFEKATTLGTLVVDTWDIVRFDATSLGTNTAGTFSMYFDGNDVGLDSTSENIDALDILPDGRILVSTNGNPTITGFSGLADEDILAFTPTTLGDVTSGSWQVYFDGSDVGLADSSNEDVDALDIDPNGAIYLSARSTLSVPGVSGAGEDVFVCSPTSLGSTTACNYSPTLYFEGNTWGLSGNNLDAFSIPETGMFPTATPTNTPTNTPTPSATFTPTNTPTPTSTFTPTYTPTAGPSPTATNTPTNTPTATPTFTPTNTSTPTATFTPTNTSTPTATFTPTNTPGPLPDLIFADGFESGDFSAWTSSKTAANELSVSAQAAIVGTKGMQAAINDTSTIYVTYDLPTAEVHYRARFYFDPNSISMTDGSAHYIFLGYDSVSTSAGNDVFKVDFRKFGGNYQIRLRQYLDSLSTTSTAWVTISDGPHSIEMEWWAASAVGANNGGVNLWIDGNVSGGLSGLDNDTRLVRRVELGAASSIDAGTSGVYYFDAFESRRSTYIGP